MKIFTLFCTKLREILVIGTDMYQCLVWHISQTKPSFGLVWAIYNWSVVTGYVDLI